MAHSDGSGEGGSRPQQDPRPSPSPCSGLASEPRQRRRYTYHDKPDSYVGGRWTEEEHEMFLMGLDRYGYVVAASR